MSTLTDEDLTILESLNFEPSCEKSNHDSSESARWAAIYAPRALCGCRTPGVALWCEPCRDRFTSAHGVRCNYCGDQSEGQRDTIVRFEPIS